MKTLQYLNGIAGTVVSFTDSRPSGVIFDRPQGKSYDFTASTYSFALLVGGNILEIINPVVANVRYKINLGNALATLSYASLPPGVVVSQSGTIYTIYGIDSVSDWEAVKDPNITLDLEYQGTFSYDVTILYNTDTTADNEFTWTVGVFAPVSEITSTFALSSTAKRSANLLTNLNVVSNLFVEGVNTLGTVFRATINANRTARITDIFSSAFTISCKPRQFTFADSTLTIDNPSPIENANIGRYIVADDAFITTNYNDTDIFDNTKNEMIVFDIETGDIEQNITSPTGIGHRFAGNDNWLLSQTSIISNQYTFALYEKQLSGDPWNLVDTLTKSYDAYGNVWVVPQHQKCVTNNYVAIQNTADGNNVNHPLYYANYVTEIYSIDNINGFTYLYTKQGSVQQYGGNNYAQQLGKRVAMSDDYLCLSMETNTQINGWASVLVYDTATGNPVLTVTNNSAVRDLVVYGDYLYILTTQGIIQWDLDTNTQVAAYNYTGLVRMERYGEKWMAVASNQNPSTALLLINMENGAIEATGLSIEFSDFKFVGTDILVIGNTYYDGAETDQGIIYVKKET